MMHELLSFEQFAGLHPGRDAAHFLGQFDKDKQNRVKNGGFLTVFFGLDALKSDIDRLLSADQQNVHYAIGCTWMPNYNAECWTLIPGKEYAVLFNALMLYCFQYYSYALVKTDGHLYADIGFPGELEKLEERARAAADRMVDGTKQLLTWFPPPLDWGVEDSDLGRMATQMSTLFIRFAIAHEVGHMHDTSIPETSQSAIAVANVTPRLRGAALQHEYAADAFRVRSAPEKVWIRCLEFRRLLLQIDCRLLLHVWVRSGWARPSSDCRPVRATPP